MKPTRIIATLGFLLAGLLFLSTGARASLSGTAPAGGSHHVDSGVDIVVDFTSATTGANANTFLVHGRHSGLHTGNYFGNGTSRIGFTSNTPYRAGERVDVTLTTGISGLSAPEVISYRIRGNRASAEFDTDLLGAPYTGTWPNIVSPARLLPFSSAYFYYGSASGDINGDGIPDVAVCSPFGPACVFVWITPSNVGEWNGLAGHADFAGGYLTVNAAVSGILYGVAIGDVDNDGYGDLILSMSGEQPELARYNPATSTFNTPVPFGLSTGGEHASLGDLNGDGFLDLAFSGQPNFTVFNDGQGNFSNVTALNNASFSNENVLVDIENDGDLDIVFVHGSGGVSEQDVIYLNDGTGNFSSTLPIGTPQVSMGVDAGDLDGDGDVDLAIGTTAGVEIQLNAGSFTFTQAATVAAGLDVGAISLGDLDGDGDLDLAVGVGEAGGNGQSALYFNDGDGTFSTSTPIGLASNGHWGPDIQLLDLDGDGDLDYFSGRASGGPFYLLNGADMYDDATDTFVYNHTGFDPSLTGVVPAANAPAVSPSSNISAGFNADMKGLNASNFVVRGSMTGTRAGAISGNGTSSAAFNPTADFLPGETVEVTIRGLYSETVIQDLTTTATHTTTQPMVGGHVQRFQAATQGGPLEFDQKTWNAISAGLPTKAVVCGDLDGDGQIELVFGFGTGSPKVVTVGAAGAGTPWDVATDSFDVRALDLADVDGDGDLDLAIGVNAGQSRVYLYNSAADNFTGGTINIGGASESVLALQFADMNADGRVDLVAGRAGALDIVYLNDGAGAFTAGATFGSSGSDTTALAVGDTDNDGDLDVFEGNYAGYNFLNLNDGRGGFNGVRQIGTQGVQTRAAGMADLNGDGWVDIVAGEYAGITTVHLNDGAGNFRSTTNLTSGTANTLGLKLADFDGDGDIDIATAGGQLGELFINNGAGVFSSNGTFGPSDSTAIAAADMDGDGDLDIALGRNNAADLIRFNELLPTVSFSQTQYTVNESTATATITVGMSQVHNTAVSVNWAATAGTATNGSDFTAGSGALTFTPGQTTRTFTVAILNDALDENDETVTLALSNVVGGVMGTSAATLSVLDDDGVPTVRFTTGAYTQAEGSGMFTVNVELSNPSGLPVTVSYATGNGTATAGADYAAASGQLSFAAGVLSQSFNLIVADDNIDEPDETFDIALSNPQNATIGALGTTTVTITDDDSAPAINLSPVTMTVNENAGTLNFTVSLSHPSSSAISLAYMTQNGSASAGQDYVALTGSLVIPAGSTSGTLALTINDDSKNEPLESFQLLLANPVGGVLGADSLAVITIMQDPDDVFQVGAASGGNGGGGGGGCVAADTNTGWMFLLLVSLLGLAVLRTRRAR